MVYVFIFYQWLFAFSYYNQFSKPWIFMEVGLLHEHFGVFLRDLIVYFPKSPNSSLVVWQWTHVGVFTDRLGLVWFGNCSVLCPGLFRRRDALYPPGLLTPLIKPLLTRLSHVCPSRDLWCDDGRGGGEECCPVSALKITRSRLSLSRGGSAAAATLRPAGDRSVGARLCVLLHSRSPHVPPTRAGPTLGRSLG